MSRHDHPPGTMTTCVKCHRNILYVAGPQLCTACRDKPSDAAGKTTIPDLTGTDESDFMDCMQRDLGARPADWQVELEKIRQSYFDGYI